MKTARTMERERRSKWSFYTGDDGMWLWRMTPPEGRESSAKESFPTLTECILEGCEKRRRKYTLDASPVDGKNAPHRRLSRKEVIAENQLPGFNRAAFCGGQRGSLTGLYPLADVLVKRRPAPSAPLGRREDVSLAAGRHYLFLVPC